MKKLYALICVAFCSNAAFAEDIYRCEGEIGFSAKNALIGYNIDQYSESDVAVMIILDDDWSSLQAARFEEDSLQYEYPNAIAVGFGADETMNMHTFYSFDANNPRGHNFVIIYRNDGGPNGDIEPKSSLGLQTISYNKNTTIASYFICKPWS